MDDLVTNELLTSCQHGSIKHHSCVAQLLATLDPWTEIMDHGDIGLIHLDCSTCIDSVPHERLLMKLQKCGITGRLWRFAQRQATAGLTMGMSIRGGSCSQCNPPREHLRTITLSPVLMRCQEWCIHAFRCLQTTQSCTLKYKMTAALYYYRVT